MFSEDSVKLHKGHWLAGEFGVKRSGTAQMADGGWQTESDSDVASDPSNLNPFQQTWPG